MIKKIGRISLVKVAYNGADVYDGTFRTIPKGS